MHLPSLFSLRTLEAAARHGSYSGAARELALTQGAVSQQIRKLEMRYGVRLFYRRGNEMIPTVEAERLASEVKDILDRLRLAIADLVKATDQEVLVVSADARFASLWLGPKLPSLLAHPAGAKLNIRVEERIANFRTDGVDAAIRMGRGDWPDLECQRLTTDRLWLVCSPAFAALHPITCPDDLLTIPLIHSHENLWPLLLDRYGLPAPPAEGLVSNDSMLVLDAVLRGLGAALLRNSMVEENLRAGELTRPLDDSIILPRNFVRPGRLVRFVRESDGEPPELGYFLVWPRESQKRNRINALREWLVGAGNAREALCEIR